MIIGVITARMGSSRFPGKPLAPIHGMPMIGHVYHRSCGAQSVDATYIATCDDEIKAYADAIGAPCVMTSAAHERASDRMAEAMETIERETGRRTDIAVLIQGDEPMLLPEQIDAAVAALRADSDAAVVNLVADITDPADFDDPNEIKVVVDRRGYALYFSRAPIPSPAKFDGPVPMRKQVCVIPFRRDDLIAFNATPPTPLEAVESIDMMRILENGGKVRMAPTTAVTYSVDTPQDLARVVDAMRGDPLMARYAGGA